MAIHAVHAILGSVAGIRAGYPFRGPIAEVREGSVRAVQMKDMDPVDGVHWNSVVRTEIASRRQTDWIEANDLLFVSRGTRFYAVCLDIPPGPAVCGPHLFHLRLKASELLPAFLAWQINQPPFQRSLQRAAEGSGQLSLRRPVLESLSVGVPSMADQQRIVEFAGLARRERHLLSQLLRNREQHFESIAEALADRSEQP